MTLGLDVVQQFHLAPLPNVIEPCSVPLTSTNTNSRTSPLSSPWRGHTSIASTSTSTSNRSALRKKVECEALIIGCGIAGNAAALRLANQGLEVTMIAAAEDPHHCATYWAQGGIIYKGKDDDTPELLAQDIHRAGAGICDPKAVEKLTVEGPQRVKELLLEIAKVPFEVDEKGELALTLEASHNRARILYKADHTGKAIAESMIQAIRNHPKIQLLTGRTAFELILDEENKCRGILAINNRDNGLEFYQSNFTLLATGGTGDLYKNTSNPEGARGEGVGLAARAGAKLKNMQYIQFHPTTLYLPNEKRFLLTEALRGEGAILKDRKGRAFAKDYHPAGELAPRDVVARMILSEMDKQQEACMFLDISHMKAEWIQKRFPTIYQHCLRRDMDMTKQTLPIVPAAHYHCGGIEVDLNGCTSINGLYAAGEVSCTGVHGANRLASTSLLEGLVWGCSSVDHFLTTSYQKMSNLNSSSSCCLRLENQIELLYGSQNITRLREVTSNEVDKWMGQLQLLMWEKVGPRRTKKGLQEAIEQLMEMEFQVDKMYRECKLARATVSLRNAIRTAKEITIAARDSSLSIGTHYIMEDK
jgi:L-aspartate oxidase